MVITDRYDHTIDEKGRLAIPSSVRGAMDPELDGTAFIVVPEGRYLQLIPEKMFQREAGLMTAGLTVPPAVAKARRLLFATATRLEPDKSGRVIVPDRFRAKGKSRDPFSEAVLGDDVTLVGVGDRMELWNRDDFYAHLRELMADRHNVAAAGQAAVQPGPVAGSNGTH